MNRKMKRWLGGNTNRPEHISPDTWDNLPQAFEAADREVFKAKGGKYRRPTNMHFGTLAGHRCMSSLRRGSGASH